MILPNDSEKTLKLLRELPAEVSLEQVGQMVVAFPLAGATAWWLAWSKFNLNSILMTSAGTLIVGGGIYLFSAGAPAATEAASATSSPMEAMEEAIVLEEAQALEEPAVVLAIPEARQEPLVADAQVPAPAAQPAPAHVWHQIVAPAEPEALAQLPGEPSPVIAPTPAVVLRMHDSTRTFDLKGFTSLSLMASIDVVVEQGEFSVIAVGEKDPLDRLKVSVENANLKIDMEEPKKGMDEYSCSGSLKVVVKMPQLQQVELLGSGGITVGQFDSADKLALLLRGSGDLMLEGFTAVKELKVDLEGSGDILCGEMKVEGSTRIQLSGSGDIHLAGSTADIDIALIGSGDVAAGAMKAGTGKVRVMGSGDVGVHTEGELDAQVHGSGEVHTSGSGGGKVPRGVGARSY